MPNHPDGVCITCAYFKSYGFEASRGLCTHPVEAEKKDVRITSPQAYYGGCSVHRYAGCDHWVNLKKENKE